MTTTTFFHLILPTGSIVGNKRSKDESEKMSLWWVLEGEAVFMASAFYDLNLFLIGNWSSSYISDGQNDTKTFVTLYHKIVPQKNLRAQNSEYLPLLLVLCLSLSFNCSFDSWGPCYQSDGGCRVTTFNTQKEVLLHSKICLGLFLCICFYTSSYFQLTCKSYLILPCKYFLCVLNAMGFFLLLTPKSCLVHLQICISLADHFRAVHRCHVSLSMTV